MSDEAVAERYECKRTECTKRVPQIAANEGDPYCSTECCKRDHGVYVESKTEEAQRKRAEAAALMRDSYLLP